MVQEFVSQNGNSWKKITLPGTFYLDFEHEGNEDDLTLGEMAWHVRFVKVWTSGNKEWSSNENLAWKWRQICEKLATLGPWGRKLHISKMNNTGVLYKYKYYINIIYM